MAYDSTTQGKGANGVSLYNLIIEIKKWFQRKIKFGGADTGTVNTVTAGEGITIDTTTAETAKFKVKYASNTEVGGIEVNGSVASGTAGYVEGVSYISDGHLVLKEATSASGSTAATGGAMSASDKSKLDGIASGAEANVQSDWNVTSTSSDAYIKNKPTIGDGTLTIKRNGTNVATFSANQTGAATADITVPTALSGLTADATHRLVTDTEKTTWNGKQDAIAWTDSTGSTNIVDAGEAKKVKAGNNITFTSESGNFVKIDAKDTTYSQASTTLGLVKAGDITNTSSYTQVKICNVTASGDSQAQYNGYLYVPYGSTSAKGTIQMSSTYFSVSSGTASIKSGVNLPGTPTVGTSPSAGDSSTKIATTSWVNSAISSAVSGAAAFQGAIDGSTITETTIKATSYKAGQYWLVKTAGTYFGEVCEAGDHVYCIKDKGSSPADTDFSVIQANVEWLDENDVTAIVNAAMAVA